MVEVEEMAPVIWGWKTRERRALISQVSQNRKQVSPFISPEIRGMGEERKWLT